MSQNFEIVRLLAVSEARVSGVEALGFAWANRIFPALHDDRIAAEFEDDFDVAASLVNEILEFVDVDDRGAKAVKYYDIEDRFSSHGMGKGQLDRMQLIKVMRYFALDHRFDNAFWHRMTVAGSGPAESQSMAEPFDASRDLLAIGR